MGKTSYDINETGTDNPAFTVQVEDPDAPDLTAKATARKELDAFGEIPHSGIQDHIKFGFILTFVVTFFIVGIVITGRSV